MTTPTLTEAELLARVDEKLTSLRMGLNKIDESPTKSFEPFSDSIHGCGFEAAKIVRESIKEAIATGGSTFLGAGVEAILEAVEREWKRTLRMMLSNVATALEALVTATEPKAPQAAPKVDPTR